MPLTLLVLTSLPLVGALLPAVVWDWRWMLLGVALEEAATAWFLLRLWPAPMALSLWIAGWTALVFLAWGQIQQIRVGRGQPEAWGGRLFRFTVIGFLLLLFWVNMDTVVRPWLPEELAPETAWAALGLMVAAALHLAMTEHPYRVMLALMALVSGFVLMYAHVEHSWLLTVLLVGVKLFLGSMGGYALTHPRPGAPT